MNVNTTSTRYRLFCPKVIPSVLYRGQLKEGEFGYNHDVSLAWFDGKFHAAWNAHPSSATEGDPGQVNVLSTSTDFKTWSRPVPFLHQAEYACPPVYNPEIVAWQPNLLNVEDEELWCTWCYCHAVAKSRETPDSGTYLSILRKGSTRWMTSQIAGRMVIAGRPAIGFPTQNPFRCSSGRVLAPMVFVAAEQQTMREENNEKRNHMWDVCAYTDDAGQTWQFSNPLSRVDDHFGQWEPYFYEQADGTLRGIMRNFGGGDLMPCNQWQLTTIGSGAEKGTPVVFDADLQYAGLETGRARPQVFRAGSRYVLLMNDNYTLSGSRLNLSAYFSRSGANDFVAGISFSPQELYSTYPQGITHAGKLYIAYTTTENEHKQWCIRGAVIDAPESHHRYLWPRAKRIEEWKWNAASRTRERQVSVTCVSPVTVDSIDARQVVSFKKRASVGVEIDTPDWSKPIFCVEIDFEFKVEILQKIGNLILMSFGDINPIRIGMPSNRPGKLYAWTRTGWRCLGAAPISKWIAMSIRIENECFHVAIKGDPAHVFDNPAPEPNARFYLGDGFEIDYCPSNLDSIFYVDLNSIDTRTGMIKR